MHQFDCSLISMDRVILTRNDHNSEGAKGVSIKIIRRKLMEETSPPQADHIRT